MKSTMAFQHRQEVGLILIGQANTQDLSMPFPHASHPAVVAKGVYINLTAKWCWFQDGRLKL